jgi:Fe-S cluster assembly protein SufD
MSTVAERSSLLADYPEFLAGLGPQPEALRALRAAALERFEAMGVPTTRHEDWRFTNVAPIERTAFVRPPLRTDLQTAQLQPFHIADTVDLVFVNGRFEPSLSRLDLLPPGIVAGGLDQALKEHPDLVLPHLAAYADGKRPFVALNTAHVRDGAFIHVPAGVKVATPLHLLFLATGGEQPTVSYPRCLIVAEPLAELTVIESYSGFAGDRYFTCAVTEILGRAGSVVDHYRLGQESLDAFHIATLHLQLERDAQCFTHSIAHGGAIARNDIHAVLDGEGISCTLNGLYLARGKQLVDHHMWIDHAKPHCQSYELFKGILEDEARAVFNGRIHVHQDAQKTNAMQSNRNLLLSDSAICHSNPQLEIFADDVRCTHGSTTGHLDDDAVFYLRSRGIGEDAAKSLLTYAFAAEVLKEVRLEAVRKDVEEFLFTRLPKGDVVRQAV